MIVPSPPVSLIADPAELLARVPTSGPLGEEDLILLAIGNHPGLERRRADIAAARAEKRAVQDLPNPELRLSYGSQHDDMIRRPYTETTFRAPTPFPTPGYKEVERIITPHRNGEDVIINDYGDVFSDGNVLNRNLFETTYERQISTAVDGREEQFAALVRFRIPHRFEKKARLQRASAEILLAESQYLADEDKLVRDVRERFQELRLMQSTLAAQRKRREGFSTFLQDMQKENRPEFYMDIARVRIEITKHAFTEIRKLDTDINRVRNTLAVLCGLRDASRIQSGGLIIRRVADVAALDSAYLAEMAMLYRADMVQSRARLQMAKAHLAEAEAVKIPWASFIDAGFTRQRQEGRSGEQDEWMVRIAFDIPLWEWTKINKRSAAHRTAATAWEVQLEKQRQRVSAEVGLAIDGLRQSSALLRDYESSVRREHREIKQNLEAVKASTTDLNDYSRFKRAESDANDVIQQMEIARYQAYSDYNDALMALEDAIGVRLEKVLSGSRAK